MVSWREAYSIPSPVALSLIVPAMVMDLFTLGCLLRRNVRDHGTSGCTVVTWFVYLFMVLASRPPLLFHVGPNWFCRLLGILAFTGYTSLCHLFIPMLHADWLRRKRGETGPDTAGFRE